MIQVHVRRVFSTNFTKQTKLAGSRGRPPPQSSPPLQPHIYGAHHDRIVYECDRDAAQHDRAHIKATLVSLFPLVPLTHSR